ncbi:hypothetical protein FLL45_21980 [Aliikangiella marina]|uniref:Uncharacterized protein n=1 Tax=Aliikangiella marina TaxID=1712262 RepID=A0A545T1C9_9GAMM|nr:hypothetical protein [Aliikangiella marina]TQV70999.1 hypothetical protein FLL45_21980 [Aliikangiella marina]
MKKQSLKDIKNTRQLIDNRTPELWLELVSQMDMMHKIIKELSLYFGYLFFIPHPTYEELSNEKNQNDNKLARYRLYLVLFSFLAFLFALVEHLPFDFLKENSTRGFGSDLLAVVALCSGILIFIAISNAIWVWLMRAFKLLDEDVILRVIRYGR